MNPWGTHVAGMNVLLNHYRSKAKTDPIVDVICRYEQKAKLVRIMALSLRNPQLY